MIGTKQRPKSVMIAAYKLAVTDTLVAFFGKPRRRAIEITELWSERLHQSRAMKAALFLHTEPLKTAATLVGVDRPVLATDEKLRYDKILRDSMAAALANYTSGALKNTSIKAAFKKPVAAVDSSDEIAALRLF